MGDLVYGDAIHIQKQAQIDAARKTEASGNLKRGAESELQRFSASLGNQRRMDAAGKTIDATTENIGRNLDAATFGTFESRIAAAEELGASLSNASAAGVGGSSVETYNNTLRLRQSMQEEQTLRAVNSDNINVSKGKGDVLNDAVGSLDNNVYAANLDFNEYVDHHKQSTFAKIATVAAAAAATYFTGSPQAGAAVLGLSEAQQAASNGDFGSASQSLMGTIRSGTTAFKDVYSMRGSTKAPAAAKPSGSGAKFHL